MAAGAPPHHTGSVADARSLAARLPDLLVAAHRVAANAMFGSHGRRRPGTGETFWQYRSYQPGEPAKRIDWRRSARDHHLFVREREWEAVQTVWLWPDLSPSMRFRSRLAAQEKAERALILILALAELLGRGGERVGIPGLVPARPGRDLPERFAEALLRGELADDWPTTAPIKPLSDVVIVSDFLTDPETIHDRFRHAAEKTARLHLLQILDPAEETFPYGGRLEFEDPETGGTWLAERADLLKEGYRARLLAHRDEIARLAQRAGFSFSVHHTDRPASEGLLVLQSSLAGPSERRLSA
ncbi:DUF58 domain-containing protein [Afifella aestuarii]|uniref:DUF58 domain-containing protein n=1 Tax=Afifella aestuarii TaxID=1909496 RepID=UPI000FE3C308|nr:DUF58 domain-containing protein [Afifella aestuarii]